MPLQRTVITFAPIAFALLRGTFVYKLDLWMYSTSSFLAFLSFDGSSSLPDTSSHACCISSSQYSVTVGWLFRLPRIVPHSSLLLFASSIVSSAMINRPCLSYAICSLMPLHMASHNPSGYTFACADLLSDSDACLLASCVCLPAHLLSKWLAIHTSLSETSVSSWLLSMHFCF